MQDAKSKSKHTDQAHESILDKYNGLRKLLQDRYDLLLLLNAMEAIESIEAIQDKDTIPAVLFIHFSYKMMAESMGRVQMEFVDKKEHQKLRDLIFVKMPEGGEGCWYDRLPFAHAVNLFNLINNWRFDKAGILQDITELKAELLKILSPILPGIKKAASLPFDVSHVALPVERYQGFAVRFRQVDELDTPEARHLHYIALTIEIGAAIFVNSNLFRQSLCLQSIAAALIVFINNNMKELEALNFRNLSDEYPAFRGARNDFAHAVCLEDVVGNPDNTWREYLQPCFNDFKRAVQSQIAALKLPPLAIVAADKKASPTQAMPAASTTAANAGAATTGSAGVLAAAESDNKAGDSKDKTVSDHKAKKKKPIQINPRLQKLIEIIRTSKYSKGTFKAELLAVFESRKAIFNNEVLMHLLQSCVGGEEINLLDNLLNNLKDLIEGSVARMLNTPIKANFLSVVASEQPNTFTFDGAAGIKRFAIYRSSCFEKDHPKFLVNNHQVFLVGDIQSLSKTMNIYLLAVIGFKGRDVRFRNLITKLTKMGANPNVSYGLDPLLHGLIPFGAAVTETILAAGANPSLPDQYGRSPLLLACELNLVDCVRLLLHYKADIFRTSSYGIVKANILGLMYFCVAVNDAGAKILSNIIIQEAVSTKGYAAAQHLLRCKTTLHSAATGYKNSGPFSTVMTDIQRFPQARNQTLLFLQTINKVLMTENVTLHKLLLMNSAPAVSQHLAPMSDTQVVATFKDKSLGMNIFAFATECQWSDFGVLAERVVAMTPSSNPHPATPIELFDSMPFKVNSSIYFSCHIRHQLYAFFFQVLNYGYASSNVAEITYSYFHNEIDKRFFSYFEAIPNMCSVRDEMFANLFARASAAWPAVDETALAQIRNLTDLIREYLGYDRFVDQIISSSLSCVARSR